MLRYSLSVLRFHFNVLNYRCIIRIRSTHPHCFALVVLTCIEMTRLTVVIDHLMFMTFRFDTITDNSNEISFNMPATSTDESVKARKNVLVIHSYSYF